MSRAEIADRSPFQILLDDRRADIRRACHRSGIPEAFADLPHYGRHLTARVGRARRWRPPCELNRSDQRPAPGSEILSRELRSEIHADVIIEPLCVGSSDALGRFVLD